VDDPLLSVHLDNLSFTALEATAHDDHFVILADWEGSDLQR
jgi:hypothetical protein